MQPSLSILTYMTYGGPFVSVTVSVSASSRKLQRVLPRQTSQRLRQLARPCLYLELPVLKKAQRQAALLVAKIAFQHAADDTTESGKQSSAIGLQQLGFYSLTEKSYSKAVEQLEESARRDPKQAMSWVWLGQARQNAGDRAGAVDAYKKALEIKPGQPDATKGLKSLGA